MRAIIAAFALAIVVGCSAPPTAEDMERLGELEAEVETRDTELEIIRRDAATTQWKLDQIAEDVRAKVEAGAPTDQVAEQLEVFDKIKGELDEALASAQQWTEDRPAIMEAIKDIEAKGGVDADGALRIGQAIATFIPPPWGTGIGMVLAGVIGDRLRKRKGDGLVKTIVGTIETAGTKNGTRSMTVDMDRLGQLQDAAGVRSIVRKALS